MLLMNKMFIVFVLTISRFHSTCSPVKVVHKNRSINSVVCLYLLKNEFCGYFCEASWLRFGTQKHSFFLSPTNTNSNICARDSSCDYIHFILAQHRVRGCILVETRVDAETKRHNFHLFSLGQNREENYAACRYHSRCFQFARKLRWFLLASFINSFYQLHKGTEIFFHQKSAHPPIGCV